MNLNKILRYISLTGLFLIPLVFLVVVTSFFFPYITGKNFLFRILVEIIFGAWAILAFRDPAYRPKWKSLIVISLLVFMGVVFIADLFGEYFFKSFWSDFERMEGYVTFLHLLALFFVATIMLQGEKMWKRFFHVAFAVSIILGFIGINQHFLAVPKVDRIDATLGNSTYLGALMLFNIFLLLFYFMRTIREKIAENWKYLASGYALAIIFDAYILYLTGTRGAFLGVLGGIVFIALVLAIFEREQKVIKRSGIALLVLMILGLGFMVTFRNSNFVKNNDLLSRFSAPVNAVLTFNVTSFAETEGKGRLLIWQSAWKGFQDRPLLGWGQENFNYIFNKYYVPEMYTQESWFDRSHNVILDWLTQAGILGLLSYLSLFGFLVYGIWKKGQNNFSLEDRAVLTGLLIAYFIHNLFVFDNITSYILFFAVLAYVNRVQYQSINSEKKSLSIHPDISNYALAPIILVIVAGAFYFSVWRPYTVSVNLIKALLIEQKGDVLSTLSYYQQALDHHTFGSPEAREQMLQAIPFVLAANADQQAKQDFVNYIENQMTDQLKRTPNDARYFLFYGAALDRLGDVSNAATYLARAEELSPQKQAILFEVGLNDLAQKQNAKAVDLLKKTYETSPDFDEAKINYAIALIYSGDNVDADKLLANPSNTILSDNRLLKAYYDSKQYQKAINIYHMRETMDPTNPQNYLGAAGFYIVAGDRNAAIAELVRLEAMVKQLSATDPGNLQYSEAITAVEGFITKIKAGENPLPITS